MTKHNIVHIEIPTKDSKESAVFYEKLFGWRIEHVPEMNYTMWDPQDGPGGGFSPLGDEVKVGEVLLYVNSDDIKADLNQAEALGGAIVRPKDEIPGTGWFGIFRDPTGNLIALYTSMNPDFNK